MNEQEPRHARKFVPATMERTARRFESRIVEGITAAREEQREIDHLTARMISHALGRALGRASALAEFGRTGEGSYDALSAEYLGLYTDPTTPLMICEWIDWLGTHLLHQEDRGSGRRFMGEAAGPDLSRLLVTTRIGLRGTDCMVQLPASMPASEVTRVVERLEAFDVAATPAFLVFLALPDVDASSPHLVESFHETYVGSFDSIEDALYRLVELEEWETDLHNFAADRGILPQAVSIDHDVIEAQTMEIYDLVEQRGVVYAFNK